MANASTIRGGKVFIEVLMNSSEAMKEVDALQKRLNAFTASVGKVGLLFSGIGAGITAPLAFATKSFASAGDAMDKLGKRTGASVESLSALEYAAEQTGASFGAIESGAQSLYSAIDKATRGNAKAIASFTALGLKAEDLAGLPLADQFSAIAGGMSRLSTSAEKSAVATRLFGSAGFQLLPMLKSGAAEMAKHTRQAEKWGVVMSKDDAEAAARLSDAMSDVKYAFKGLNASIGAALAPVATSFAEAAAGAVAFTSSILRSSPGLVQFASAVGSLTAALGGAGLGLAGVSKAASLTIAGFKSARDAYRAFSAVMKTDSLKSTALAFGALGVKIALVTAALYAAYEAYRTFADSTKNMENFAKSAALNAPSTPGTKKLEKEASDRHYKGGEKSDAIQADFQKRYDALYEEYKGLNWLTETRGASKADLAHLDEVKTKMQDLTLIIERIKANGGIDEHFFALSKATVEQQEAFNASLEKTKEKLDEINAARMEQKESRTFESMIDTAPDAANTVINEKADAALAEERDIQEQIVELKKQQLEATKEEMPELQKQVELLGDQAIEAAKRVDAMEDWRRKAGAAVDDVKKRAGEMVNQFDRLKSDNAARAQEKAFRKLLDSGNWKEANDSVIAEMVQLEAAWAKNTAAVTDALARAMNGNLDALNEVQRLYNEQQDLSSRRETMEDRTVDVESVRAGVDDARRNVMSMVDPGRSAAETRALVAELKTEMQALYRQSLQVESEGGDASTAWIAADKLASKISGLEAFLPNRDELAGSLAGGTFSGEAASRMGGGGGGQQIERDQLEVQRQMLRKLDSIDRKADDGGLGV